jgi:hypothetical protein
MSPRLQTCTKEFASVVLPVTILPHVALLDEAVGFAAASVMLVVSVAILWFLAPTRRSSKPPS